MKDILSIVKTLTVLVLVSGLMFGVGRAWQAGLERHDQKQIQEITKQLSEQMQKSIDAKFNQISRDFKKDIENAVNNRKQDETTANYGSALLNGVGSGWVPVVVPSTSTTTCPTPQDGDSERRALTKTIRAELSADFSRKLKAESRRADSCAVDYNELYAKYMALASEVKTYNDFVDVYNLNNQTKK